MDLHRDILSFEVFVFLKLSVGNFIFNVKREAAWDSN